MGKAYECDGCGKLLKTTERQPEGFSRLRTKLFYKLQFTDETGNYRHPDLCSDCMRLCCEQLARGGVK